MSAARRQSANPVGGTQKTSIRDDPDIMSKAVCWENGAVVCDKYIRHGTCSRENCPHEHRSLEDGEVAPLCWNYLFKKDGCTKGFQCKLTHRKRVPKAPTPPPAQTQGSDTNVACENNEQRVGQREDSASGAQGFVPPHLRRPPPSGPAAMRTNRMLRANTNVGLDACRPGTMSGTRQHQAPSSFSGQPQPGIAQAVPASTNMPPHMRAAPPRTIATSHSHGPPDTSFAAPAPNPVPPHMRVGSSSGDAINPNGMRSHTQISTTNGYRTENFEERTDAEKLSLGAGIDSLTSRVAAADHHGGIPLTGTRPRATSAGAPVFPGKDAYQPLEPCKDRTIASMCWERSVHNQKHHIANFVPHKVSPEFTKLITPNNSVAPHLRVTVGSPTSRYSKARTPQTSTWTDIRLGQEVNGDILATTDTGQYSITVQVDINPDSALGILPGNYAQKEVKPITPPTAPRSMRESVLSSAELLSRIVNRNNAWKAGGKRYNNYQPQLHAYQQPLQPYERPPQAYPSRSYEVPLKQDVATAFYEQFETVAKTHSRHSSDSHSSPQIASDSMFRIAPETYVTPEPTVIVDREHIHLKAAGTAPPKTPPLIHDEYVQETSKNGLEMSGTPVFRDDLCDDLLPKHGGSSTEHEIELGLDGTLIVEAPDQEATSGQDTQVIGHKAGEELAPQNISGPPPEFAIGEGYTDISEDKSDKCTQPTPRESPPVPARATRMKRNAFNNSEKLFTGKRHSRHDWEVSRCFKCWSTSHHSPTFCPTKNFLSLEQMEKRRAELRIVNRRFTEMMLSSRNIEETRAIGAYKQHLVFSRLWSNEPENEARLHTRTISASEDREGLTTNNSASVPFEAPPIAAPSLLSPDSSPQQGVPLRYPDPAKDAEGNLDSDVRNSTNGVEIISGEGNGKALLCWHCQSNDHGVCNNCLKTPPVPLSRPLTPPPTDGMEQSPGRATRSLFGGKKALLLSQPGESSSFAEECQSLQLVQTPATRAVPPPTGWVTVKSQPPRHKQTKALPTTDPEEKVAPKCDEWDGGPGDSARTMMNAEPLVGIQKAGSNLTTTAVWIKGLNNILLQSRSRFEPLQHMIGNAKRAATHRADIEQERSRPRVHENPPKWIREITGSRFMELPPELVEEIFIIVVGECSQFMASRQAKLGIDFDPAKMDTMNRWRALKGVRTLCRKFKRAAQKIIYRYVGISDYDMFARFIRVINEYPDLATHVHAVKIQITPSMTKSLVRTEHPLQQDYTGSLMIRLVECCTRLQLLSVEMPYALFGFGSITGEFPHMREIRISETTCAGLVLPRMWKNLGFFPNLTHFDIKYPRENDKHDFGYLELPSRDLTWTIRMLPRQLTNLTIEYAPELSDRILAAIVTHCPELSVLSVKHCKLVTTTGYAKAVKILGPRLRDATFYVWQSASGRILPLERERYTSHGEEHHLCEALHAAATSLEVLDLRIYRLCERFWTDVTFDRLHTLHLVMYQFRHCRQKIHDPDDEKKYNAMMRSALRDRRFPALPKPGLIFRLHVSGISFQRTD